MPEQQPLFEGFHPEGQPHYCHALGCTVQVPPKLLMCLRHWHMVPRDLQKMIWRCYRPGQEIDKHPSRGYVLAMKAAIEAVRQKENHRALMQAVRG